MNKEIVQIYIDGEATFCPICHSRRKVECTESLHSEGTSAYQHCVCHNCCEEWDDVYELTAIRVDGKIIRGKK